MKSTGLPAIKSIYEYDFNHVRFPRQSRAGYQSIEIKITA